MNFDLKSSGKKISRDKSMIKLLKSATIMASGILNILNLSSDPNELGNRLKLLLQEKPADKNSDIIKQEVVAIIDKLLQYQCISKKQHKQVIFKCNQSHKRV